MCALALWRADHVAERTVRCDLDPVPRRRSDMPRLLGDSTGFGRTRAPLAETAAPHARSSCRAAVSTAACTRRDTSARSTRGGSALRTVFRSSVAFHALPERPWHTERRGRGRSGTGHLL